MLRIISILSFVFVVYCTQAAPETPVDQQFKEKLSESISKTEKSIKLLRKQIIESQNAPFLPDLYVQLGDLLSQKALTLYYIQMERDSKLEPTDKKSEDTQLVLATKEAIDVYRTVLKDFPSYSKRGNVTYKLANALKSIDETVQFIIVASKLIQDFPGTEDAMRANLLLGRHFLDGHEYDESYKFLKVIEESKFVYEKNLARYWIGLIYMGKEKFADALHQFEAVIGDPELKEQENPYDIKKNSSQSQKSDLKREALIDSIRAFTSVYEVNPKPIEYYSKLCPTETHFQEVMEKLALRYVLLKKYDESVKLLRTTSERTANPEKIIKVYREVLLMIPLQQRLALPVVEMRFVLQKLILWRNYFEVPSKVLSDSYWYFEKQVRDVGTRNHDLAKLEKNPELKKRYLEFARDYYLLYLGFFERTVNSVKMATDLADVYFLQENYFESGGTYLKIFQDEYGISLNKKALIENAILALQKDKSETFYARVRAKGLLIESIVSYQKIAPKLKSDPTLTLLKLKTEYELGFLPKSIDSLYEFMKAQKGNPLASKQVIDAGDLIMDYYNTLSDFQSLQFWSEKLLLLKLPKPEFNEKLMKIKAQAKNKVIQEKVKAIAGYDEFSQGKSYLAVAMKSDDVGLQDSAFKEALKKSKNEHDIETFLQAANLMVSKQSNTEKRAALLRSISQENIKIGRFYSGIASLKQATTDTLISAASKIGMTEDLVNTAIVLHDLATLQEIMNNPNFDKISAATKARVREQIADALDSPVDLTDGEVGALLKMSLSEDSLLALYKGKAKLSPALRAKIDNDVKSHCGADSKQTVCLWTKFAQLEPERAKIIQLLKSVSPDLKSLEPAATQFMDIVRKFQVLEGSADPHLETALSLRGKELYLNFANYLVRVANANPSLKADILLKAKESQASYQLYQQKCNVLVDKSLAINPSMKYCSNGTFPTLEQIFTWKSGLAIKAQAQDSQSTEVVQLQKSIFSNPTDADPVLKLALVYLNNKDYYHATALATYGMGEHKAREGDFKAILGCALLPLGFLTEAGYHLKTSTDYDGLKTRCSKTLKALRLQ